MKTKNENLLKKTTVLLCLTFMSFAYVANAQSTETNGNLNNWNPPTLPTPPEIPDFPSSSPGTNTNWHWPTWPPNPPTGTTSSSTVVVTILKYVDGGMATASSSNNATFGMTSTYNATNTGPGTGNYALGPTGNTPYQAATIGLSQGASYSTSELMNTTVGATCSTSSGASSTPFALVGYSVGNTLAEAQSAAPSLSVPSLTNLTNNKFIIVWNDNCATPGNGSGGQIGGDVIGGATTSTSTIGVLKVTSIETVQGTATADGTFDNGWKYIFNITVPTNEPSLYMKFADWSNTSVSAVIPVANNVRISSVQATSSSTVPVVAANTYTTPALTITGDLDSALPGKQVKVLVEAMVPTNSINGTYSTNYGVKTE